MTPERGRFIGEERRDEGMRRAARRKDWLIHKCALRMLEVIRHRPDRTATTDDATSDLGLKYPDGGKWRGSVPKRLAAEGLIAQVGVVKSLRPCRHRGYVTKWRGLDDQSIDAAIAEHRRWLADHPDPPDEMNGAGCLFPMRPQKPSDAVAAASLQGGAE